MEMWDDRCKVMYGMTEEENKEIKRDRILLMVRRCFQVPEGVMEGDQHVFAVGLEAVD